MAKLDVFFKRMVELGASDLHLTSSTIPLFRLHGDMVPVPGAKEIYPEEMKQLLFEIAPEGNRQEFEQDCDTDFAYELEGAGRFRSNFFVDHKGPGAVFRLIPSKILTAEDLSLPQSVMDMCYLTKGLVVVTGPTGSGKSTTLAAMIDHINKQRADHVITIEDPIEFVHRSQKCLVNQREVGKHTSGFKRALRAALREDPDIVLVGEMRDLETIEIAIETAETGHLVFGTLHTTTAATTVDRIIDQFPTERQAQIRTMLSSSLKGVVAQTLCKKKPTGRVAALEILVVNAAISAQIREGKTHQINSQLQMGSKLGMCLLNDSLVNLVQQGLVDPGEAYLKAVNKSDLIEKLSRIGIKIDLNSTRENDPPQVQAGRQTPQMANVRAPLPGPAAPQAAPAAPAFGSPQQAPAYGQPQPPAAPKLAPQQNAPGGDPFEEFKRNRSN